MKKFYLIFALCLTLFIAGLPAFANNHEAHRYNAALRAAQATEFLREVFDAPERTIPTAVLAQAKLIAVFPYAIKHGSLVDEGYGIASVREPFSHHWTAPVALRIGQQHIGSELIGDNVELILIGTDVASAEAFRVEHQLIAGNAIAPGPVADSSLPDSPVVLPAHQFICYQRVRDQFIGTPLAYSEIVLDSDSNRGAYQHKKVDVFQEVSETVPATYLEFADLLNQRMVNESGN